MTTQVNRKLNTGPVIHREKVIVAKMILIYCKKKHRNKELCEECSHVQEYALNRLSACRFGEDKKACAKCPIHCYKPDYRQKIRQIMRFSGPWMLLYHPIESIRHIPLPDKWRWRR